MSAVPRVSVMTAPQTARGPGERMLRPTAGPTLRSPRLNTQQVLFWPTAQTVQNLPMASPNGVSPRQISSGGDPLRFLGSGYPPRQMLTSRKGEGVDDAVSSYVPAEVNVRPLTTKVFGPPVARPVVDPKHSTQRILRSFSGAMGKEVAESPRQAIDPTAGPEAAGSAASTTPATPGPMTPMAVARAPVILGPSSSPSVPLVPPMVPIPVAKVEQEPMRLRWPVGSSTPTLSKPSVIVWHGYSSSRPTPVAPVPSPKVQPRTVAAPSSPSLGSEASPDQKLQLKEPKEPKEPKEGTEDKGESEEMEKESPEVSNEAKGVPKEPPAVFKAFTPMTSPREMAEKFLAGTYTPPHFQMLRSTSTQPDTRPTSPHGRLGVTVRNLSPQTRGTGGHLISPSPLSFSARQPPVPRRSGSPLSSKADLHSPPATIASPMARQRTLPGNLQHERSSGSSTKILTAPVATPATPETASRSSLGPELTSEKPPARAVGEGRPSEIRRRCWRRPSNPAIPHRPTEVPSASHDGIDFTPAFMRLQEKLGYLAEEGTVSL